MHSHLLHDLNSSVLACTRSVTHCLLPKAHLVWPASRLVLQRPMHLASYGHTSRAAGAYAHGRVCPINLAVMISKRLFLHAQELAEGARCGSLMWEVFTDPAFGPPPLPWEDRPVPDVSSSLSLFALHPCWKTAEQHGHYSTLCMKFPRLRIGLFVVWHWCPLSDPCMLRAFAEGGGRCAVVA